jgi:beta-phosphoglucomutase family hydrolase
MTKGVIFDMDGVIVLTEHAHWLAWQAAAQRINATLDYATFLSCFGRVNADCIRIMFGEHIPHGESLRIADEKEHAFREIIRSNVPLAPGLLPLLDNLARANARLAVGSSAPPENVALVLDAGSIRQSFQAVVDGSQVTRGKPAPDVFLQAAALLAIQPARCAVIEDAPAGIQAAKAAGMLGVGVATTHKAHELTDAGADIVYPTLADVPLHLLV